MMVENLNFGNMYPKELEPKVEHQGNHATLLNLDKISQEGNLYI